jgi:hypothetical protein
MNEDLAQEMIDAHAGLISDIGKLRALNQLYGLPASQLELLMERDLNASCRAWLAERTTIVTVQRPWYRCNG